jgi:hypothetical protein
MFDRNVRDAEEFSNELDYIHRNPVKRGLVEQPEDWKWSSYRHYALREVGPVAIESEWTARDREAKLTDRKRKFLPPPSSSPGTVEIRPRGTRAPVHEIQLTRKPEAV